MTTRKFKALPPYLAGMLPILLSKPADMVRAMKKADFAKSTSGSLLPVCSAAWVALRYDAGNYTSAYLIDADRTVENTDCMQLLPKVPSQLPSLDTNALFGVSPQDDARIYVLGQVVLRDRKQLPSILEKLPRIKNLTELGAYFLRSDTPNTRLAGMLRFVAHDMLIVVNKAAIRAEVQPRALDSFLTTVGFDVLNTRGGNAVKVGHSPDLVTPLFCKRQLALYQEANADAVKVTGLRIVSTFACDSVYSNLVWREPK